jgi:ATP-dependent DNA ligase
VKAFARMYEELDRTTSTNAKVAAMAAYFRAAPPGDAAWALFFLTQRKVKRLLPTRVLWELTMDMTGVPGWLLEHCYAAVGDGAELVALMVDRPSSQAEGEDLSLERWMQERVLPLKDMDLAAQAEAMRAYWTALDTTQIFVLNKIITGELRVGVSATLAIRALAKVADVPQSVMAHRVMGDWQPSAEFFRRLLTPEPESRLDSHPYPFFLASPLEGEPASLGPREEWMAEWKWDGIRAQLVRRGGATYVWSRGEELVTERFPEVVAGATHLPEGTVLDGELLAFRGEVLPFAVLQTRIGRQKLSPSILAEAPVALMAYDLLEEGGEDLRERPLAERRGRLEALLERAASPALRPSPVVEGAGWDDLARVREEARARNVEGLMLKRLTSPYRAGRRRGDWWKWKIAPYTLDTVLIYAHPGHGRRASLFTDYTFAVWDGGELTPVARAYSGLSDAEIAELDAWVRRHTRERFGPTRAVEPTQVFELAFEGIAPSSRHRSGVAVRFPRILRWRKDKPAAEADTLDGVKALLTARTAGASPKEGTSA